MRWSAPIIVFAVAAAMCAVAQLAILASVIRRRSSVVDSHVPKPRAVAEIVWAIIPAIALAFLLSSARARVEDELSFGLPDAELRRRASMNHRIGGDLVHGEDHLADPRGRQTGSDRR